MPKHKLHRHVDQLWLGKPSPEIHAAIDRPYIIYGRKHRRLFHTAQEAYCIGYLAGQDYRGGLSGYLHVVTDQLCSKDKKFKNWLEYAAKQDAKRTKEIEKDAKKLKREQARQAKALMNAFLKLIKQSHRPRKRRTKRTQY